MEIATVLGSSTEPAAAATTEPGAAATQTSDWLSSIPETYRNDEFIKSHQSMDSLLSEYGTLKKTAGQSTIPDWNTPFEQNKEFFTKVGVPESADKYEIKAPETYKGEINQDFLNEMRKIAHEEKIPASAFQKFAERYMDLEQQVSDGFAATKEAQLNDLPKTLETRWGSELDVRKALALKGTQQFINGDLEQELADSGVLFSPGFLHVMSEVGKAMQAPTSPGASSTSGTGVQHSQVVSDTDTAKAAIKAIYADPTKNALIYSKSPVDRIARDELNAHIDTLYQKAYSSPK